MICAFETTMTGRAVPCAGSYMIPKVLADCLSSVYKCKTVP